MSTKKFSTDLTDRFNNLEEEYGVYLLDYLVTWNLESLYSYEDYNRRLFQFQYPDPTHYEGSTIKRYFEDRNSVPTEIQWDSNMVSGVKELVKIFGNEVFGYAFSCCVDQLNRMAEEHRLEFGHDENEDESKPDYEDEYEDDNCEIISEIDLQPLQPSANDVSTPPV